MGPLDVSIHEDGFHTLGALTYEELVPLFNRCDYFVMPSRFEAYGLVFAEALTFGLPCIGRRAYEMPYFIDEGKTGLLLDNETPTALAAHMERMLEDTSMRTETTKRRENYLQEYSWDTVASRIARCIGGNVAGKTL